MKDQFDQLIARWGGYTAPLIVAGATPQQVATVKAWMEGRNNTMRPVGEAETMSLLHKALSLPFASVSNIDALLSTHVPGTTHCVTSKDLRTAIAAEWECGIPCHQFLLNRKKWEKPYSPMQIRACITAKNSLSLLARVAAHLEKESHSPSPTPAKGAKKPQKHTFLGSGGVGGVVLMLLCIFTMPTFAQVQPVQGRWESLHIVHAGAVVDTIRQTVTVSRWYANCRDCDSMCIITNPVGQKCVWKVSKGATRNGTQPVEWRGRGWWYAVAPGSGQRWEVELLFRPIPNKP